MPEGDTIFRTATVLRRALRGSRPAVRAPGRSMWVYNRAGRPCRRCGTRILARRQGEQARTTYWCPQCQAGSGRLAGRSYTSRQ